MADEPRDYAILVSLSMREEAEVMASALRAEGIDAFVGNRHHTNVDWGWTIALGGMQVFTPRARLQEAKDVIRARLKEAAEAPDPEAEPTRRRDRWKVWAVIASYFGLAGYVHWLNSRLPEQVYQQSGSAFVHMDLVHISTEAEFEAYLVEYCRMNHPTEIFSAAYQGGPVRIVDCYDVLR